MVLWNYFKDFLQLILEIQNLVADYLIQECSLFGHSFPLNVSSLQILFSGMSIACYIEVRFMEFHKVHPFCRRDWVFAAHLRLPLDGDDYLIKSLIHSFGYDWV